MAFAICNEKIRLLSIRYAIYEAIRLAFFNSRCRFSIPFFGCQSFSVSQGYWFPKLWASQSCFGFPKGFWVCAKGLFPICFPVQYIRFPGGNSAVMLVGRKQTPVSEALVWDHFISDFSLAFTAFFRNQTIRSNMLRQRFWRCLVCAGTEFAKIGFAFEIMRFPFSKRDFLILRSRESPDCGSYGNGHIQWLPFLHSGTLYEFVMRLLLGG